MVICKSVEQAREGEKKWKTEHNDNANKGGGHESDEINDIGDNYDNYDNDDTN